MAYRFARKILSALMSLVLVTTCFLPSLAFAAESEVRVENHVQGTRAAQVSGLVIGDVDAPEAGERLDDTARVATAEGEGWDIPVLWVSDGLDIATEAREGESYLPVLAFFLPSDVAVRDVDQTGGFVVTLEDDLMRLFRGREIISVYDEATGITYILPASLRSFFDRAQAGQATVADPTEFQVAKPAPSDETTPGPEPDTEEPEAEPDSDADPEVEPPARNRLIDIYCARSAQDALSDDDLTFLIDLIINKLQPQAVNLLLDRFPSLAAGGKAGEIGTDIGLYIYYKKGDRDGDPAHESASGKALAYVSGQYLSRSGDVPRYGYVIGVNAGSFVHKDARDRDGRNVLVREGSTMNNLENTIVHELFHALMDDFNRTGMAGAVRASDAITDFNNISTRQNAVWEAVHYPLWFVEGTASAVENVFQYRLDTFKVLMQENARGAACSKEAIHWNYFSGKLDGDFLYFPLTYAAHDGERDEDGDIIDADASRYVTGYLAVLYLGELAARKAPEIGTSVGTSASGLTVFSSEKIRLGLDSILARLHDGETLDQVIADISPYKNVDEFEGKFIQGAVEERDDGPYYVFDDSTQFVSDFLTFMNALENDDDYQYHPNGSILFEFYRDFTTPLDRSKEAQSDYLKIVESNTYVDSTVPDGVALASGGKSALDPSLQAAADDEADDALPLAAKASAQEDAATGEGADESDVPSATEDVVAPCEESSESVGCEPDGGVEPIDTPEALVEASAPALASEDPVMASEPAAAETPAALARLEDAGDATAEPAQTEAAGIPTEG